MRQRERQAEFTQRYMEKGESAIKRNREYRALFEEVLSDCELRTWSWSEPYREPRTFALAALGYALSR